MEEVLAAIGKATGGTKPSLSTAKSTLRQAGPNGSTLAARVGRLSKARNVEGHPDVQLVEDIVAFFASLDKCGVTDPFTTEEKANFNKDALGKGVGQGIGGSSQDGKSGLPIKLKSQDTETEATRKLAAKVADLEAQLVQVKAEAKSVAEQAVQQQRDEGALRMAEAVSAAEAQQAFLEGEIAKFKEERSELVETMRVRINTEREEKEALKLKIQLNEQELKEFEAVKREKEELVLGLQSALELASSLQAEVVEARAQAYNPFKKNRGTPDGKPTP